MFFSVDVATHEKDPLRRVAFVAAFAMANYSSTIGRIAKPFNPMLVSCPRFLRFAFLFTIYTE
jgi:oxysterol-binding protein 1